MTVELRLGGTPDWDALRSLLVIAFAGMEGRIDPPSSLHGMTAEDLREKAAAETLATLWSGGDLVGCGFFRDTGEVIHLSKLAVLPVYRNRGLLRQIVEAAEAMARERGRAALELNSRVELTENHMAFGRLGFRVVGDYTHPGFDRPTSLILRKEL